MEGRRPLVEGWRPLVEGWRLMVETWRLMDDGRVMDDLGLLIDRRGRQWWLRLVSDRGWRGLGVDDVRLRKLRRRRWR